VVNKETNIDLLFRNGLRDLEVLPPAEAWNNILPVIRRKQRPVMLLRSAAVAAVLLSISFLGYKWSREFSITPVNPFSAYENAVQPVDNPIQGKPARQLPFIVNNLTEQKTDYTLAENMAAPITVTDENNPQPAVTYTEDPDNMMISDNIGIPALASTATGLRYKTAVIDAGFYKPAEIIYDIPVEKQERWSLYAGASPDYYMRPGLKNADVPDQIYQSEQSRISYSGGIGFAYKLNRKLSIQSGIYYASVGNEVAGINTFAGFRPFDQTKGDHNFEVVTASGRIYTDNSDVFLRDISGDRVLTRYTNDVFDPVKSDLSYLSNSIYQNFSYLEMPFILRYKLIDKSIDFNLIGGLAYNFLISNNVHTVINGNKYNIGKTEGLNPILVSSSMGMGIEYSITDKFSLNLEPTFRYYLNPFGDVTGVKVHPYSFGVFSGLSFKF
jgi:hypothetical protein